MSIRKQPGVYIMRNTKLWGGGMVDGKEIEKIKVQGKNMIVW